MSSESADPRMRSVVIVLNPRCGIGAGFYVEASDIVTNYHLVEGASVVEVRGFDGQLTSARVVKKDIGLDLALLRTERNGPPVQIASGVIRAGEPVEAIGHPKGLYFSITPGMVSAVRQIKGMLSVAEDKALIVQTDAAINPGNSGGPLFSKDRVIGVNTAKMARGTEGVGFAVHYSELTKFLSQ